MAKKEKNVHMDQVQSNVMIKMRAETLLNFLVNVVSEFSFDGQNTFLCHAEYQIMELLDSRKVREEEIETTIKLGSDERHVTLHGQWRHPK